MTNRTDQPYWAKGRGFRAGATSQFPANERANILHFEPGTTTATALLERIGGDFEVEKRPLTYPTYLDDGTIEQAESGLYAVVETPSNIMHGTAVSPSYEVYRHGRLAERVDETVERLGGGNVEGAYLLRDGALCVFVVSMLDQLLIGSDRSDLKMLIGGGHGGEAAIAYDLKWFRWFCENQIPGLARTLAGGGKRGDLVLSERHTAPGVARADNAPFLAEAAALLARQDASIAEILAGVEISDRQIEEFLDGELKASSDRGYAAKQNKVTKVLDRFHVEAGVNGANAWAAYNALGWWEETKGDVSKKDGNRFTRTLNRTFGGNHIRTATKFAKFHLPAVKAAELN